MKYKIKQIYYILLIIFLLLISIYLVIKYFINNKTKEGFAKAKWGSVYCSSLGNPGQWNKNPNKWVMIAQNWWRVRYKLKKGGSSILEGQCTNRKAGEADLIEQLKAMEGEQAANLAANLADQVETAEAAEAALVQAKPMLRACGVVII